MNFKIRLRYLTIFFQLLKLNLLVIFKDLKDSIFDAIIWISLSIFCNGYIYPTLGMSSAYGSLLAIGHIVSSGIFLSYAIAMVLTSDFENDKVVSYELSLPLPSWMVFAKTALAWSCMAAVLSSIILPLGKLILLSKFDLTHFSFFKFLISFIFVNLFIGCFSITMTGLNKDLLSIKRLWVRIIYPLWFLGGTIFPFNVTLKTYPKAGLILLLNPIVYLTEMIRASVLGSSAHVIPFWVCVIVVPLFSAFMFWLGFSCLKKRIDFY